MNTCTVSRSIDMYRYAQRALYVLGIFSSVNRLFVPLFLCAISRSQRDDGKSESIFHPVWKTAPVVSQQNRNAQDVTSSTHTLGKSTQVNVFDMCSVHHANVRTCVYVKRKILSKVSTEAVRIAIHDLLDENERKKMYTVK